MRAHKKSASAIFMYVVIAVTVIVSAVSFGLYYGGVVRQDLLLWVGIVAFMVMYHFWLRIIMGNVSKVFPIDYRQWWFQERFFERRLYELLRVKKWKEKVPTYNPELFSMKDYSLHEIAETMTKAELDHWINQLISLSSILFALLWGELWIFVITAVAAMLFDGQFIVIQRYNRPRVLRVMEKERRRTMKC